MQSSCLMGSMTMIAHKVATPPRKGEVQFAADSEVAFFPFGRWTPAAAWYQRAVRTKDFDGPSGHIATRTHQTSSANEVSDCKGLSKASATSSTTGGSCQLQLSSSELFYQREWCDNVVNLMNHKRQILLWSPWN